MKPLFNTSSQPTFIQVNTTKVPDIVTDWFLKSRFKRLGRKILRSKFETKEMKSLRELEYENLISTLKNTV